MRATGLRTAIFTNGTPGMIEAAVSAAGLGQHFDALVSVDPLQAYKTLPAVYRHAIDAASAGLGGRLGVVPPENAVLISSNRWDVAGAIAFGMHAVWCNRTGQPAEYADLAPRVTLPDLSGLAAAVAGLATP